ncbi:hypothetical protein QYF36_023600 [Acer negundo]|nr:hypothetical protein QYF36_023600 [Acer negundo]
MLSSSVTALESVVSGDLEDTDDQETHRPSYNSQWKKQEQDQRRREDWEVAGSTTPSRCVKGMKTMKVERDMIIIKIIGAERMMQRRMMMLGDRWQETSKAATQDMRSDGCSRGSWNTIMVVSERSGDHDGTLRLFDKMLSASNQPALVTITTYNAVYLFSFGREIHGYMIVDGLAKDGYSVSSIWKR